ncbi:hypothetical protein GGP80_000624 [Salinibacter ruber]|jgi:hypothetical protein|uniref:hypothetical protein n=1 Tax=Salinibacter ruber TaxID=146919 RepID=UPI00161478AD|nr:hypothetical protein [Salinibacter ruber]MBB4060046.1 hypothetical protein [Salinibacter ruber]MCS3934665.1 hypothetical protein [Salinibacter ruber]MCS4041711.1 hypothetical protein [Salinibacter ruber]
MINYGAISEEYQNDIRLVVTGSISEIPERDSAHSAVPDSAEEGDVLTGDSAWKLVNAILHGEVDDPNVRAFLNGEQTDNFERLQDNNPIFEAISDEPDGENTPFPWE